MKFKMIVLLLFISSLMVCSKKNSTSPEPVMPEDFLSKDNEISGWTRSGDFWTAGSGGELSSYINGAAALYMTYGFVECAAQVYEGAVLESVETVEMMVFDQGNSNNSQSLFQEVIRQMSSPMDWQGGVGAEAKIERLPMSQMIVFHRS